MATNKIVYECLDSALSHFEFIDRQTFYEVLSRKYKVDADKFADNFEAVHEALKDSFGINHYKIERQIVKILNERAKNGTYNRYDEVQAFGRMVNVFIVETEKNIKRSKSLAMMSRYAKNLEQEVKETTEKLETAERMAAIGETAAMVGHDIRNPLQAIVGEVYLEKEEITDLPDGEIKRSLLESTRAIEENLFYINKIVSDLQDFAKPIKDQTKQKVDINSVIADVLTIVPIPANLDVEIFVTKNFPILRVNQQMLKRSLSNLVQNAAQAMPDGGKLTVQALTNEENILIRVEDTGRGIPEEVKAQLFKPLFTTKAKGQGLGLAVVKRLVEAQGGTVGFESILGDGAKFTIAFPKSIAES